MMKIKRTTKSFIIQPEHGKLSKNCHEISYVLIFFFDTDSDTDIFYAKFIPNFHALLMMDGL